MLNLSNFILIISAIYVKSAWMEFQSDITGQDLLIHVAIKASIRVERAACGNLAMYLIAIFFESIVKHMKLLKTFTKFIKFYITIGIYIFILLFYNIIKSDLIRFSTWAWWAISNAS